MATNIINLSKAANDIESGRVYFNDTKINAGNFESFADFMHYYSQHYKPLLEAIRNGEEITAEQRHTLNFMADDLVKLFHEDENKES